MRSEAEIKKALRDVYGWPIDSEYKKGLIEAWEWVLGGEK
jgi:hypothetical protein